MSDVPIVLAKIEHPQLDDPILLSSDPTERLTTDPLVYGTISNGDQYLFALMSANYPDDEQGTPPSTQLVFENVTSDFVRELRSVQERGTVALSLVMASAPDVIEEQFSGLKIVSASYDANRVTLDITREPVTAEPLPAQRMTKARFPGLHR
jgi:hypothetical protein